MPPQAVQNCFNSESFGAAGRYRLKKGYFVLPAARGLESFHSLSQFSTTLVTERTWLQRVGIGSEGGEKSRNFAHLFSPVCGLLCRTARVVLYACTCAVAMGKEAGSCVWKGLPWGEAAEQKPLQEPRVFLLGIQFERLPYFRNFGRIDPLTFSKLSNLNQI